MYSSGFIFCLFYYSLKRLNIVNLFLTIVTSTKLEHSVEVDITVSLIIISIIEVAIILGYNHCIRRIKHHLGCFNEILINQIQDIERIPVKRWSYEFVNLIQFSYELLHISMQTRLYLIRISSQCGFSI